MYKFFIKRVIDFSVSLIVLLFFFPILFIVSILLLIANKGKVFFFQQRPGKDGKIFKIVKFKTMRDLYDEQGKPLPDMKRITKVGRFLRQTSLDELPQLLNVLFGQMSLIGPRPLLVSYLDLYNDFQKRRHEVKPGITGWTQVNGRNSIDWTQRFELDVWYVDNCSFLLDLKIIYKTIIKVIKREGVNASDTTTMQMFKGN
ncbi:sugar transferase [Flavobacterium aciduliphilum]|uniref:Lipopolysaccharide/colanic/teichoic acid biosynthesis glycosyltransferase n=1 Tax=Flavobacterium aciduliphilum TaxID=1101402 RepID=A0A328Y8J7_9FLAO|nr:sugar transferase [Flavobacterium aciduliphilum]RAR70239.1 lipopolysaccharide/colanic/teichoic acid biosynthesis glycosyltransferase [Flavobacterium aciduliphilum]